MLSKIHVNKFSFLCTVKPVLGDHHWEGPNVVSQGRWSLSQGIKIIENIFDFCSLKLFNMHIQRCCKDFIHVDLYTRAD